MVQDTRQLSFPEITINPVTLRENDDNSSAECSEDYQQCDQITAGLRLKFRKVAKSDAQRAWEYRQRRQQAHLAKGIGFSKRKRRAKTNAQRAWEYRQRKKAAALLNRAQNVEMNIDQSDLSDFLIKRKKEETESTANIENTTFTIADTVIKSVKIETDIAAPMEDVTNTWNRDNVRLGEPLDESMITSSAVSINLKNYTSYFILFIGIQIKIKSANNLIIITLADTRDEQFSKSG